MKRTVKSGTYIYNDVENTFNFYTTLRAVDKIRFVNTVVDTLIDDNYNSVIRDLVFDFEIIDIITDVDVSEIRETNDAINRIEDFLDETNIVSVVKSNAPELINELNNAVDLAIEYRTGIHKNSIVENLGHLLNALEKKVADIDTESMMSAAQTLSDMSGELTIDKFIEAYAKSDIFKQKYGQMTADMKEHNAKIEEIGAPIKKTRKNSKKTTTEE